MDAETVAMRQAPRFASDATLVVIEDTSDPNGLPGTTTEGRCVNVSRGGLCSELTAKVALGQPCELQMSLVFEEDVQSEPLTLRARAVWCTDLGEVWQVGFQFLAMDNAQSSYLQMFLRYLGASA